MARRSSCRKAAARGCHSGCTACSRRCAFAVWLFLAIEQLPLAAEESADPKKDMPKGLIYGMSTLMASALLITFLNSGIGSTDADKMHGAFTLSGSGEPLLDGFRVIYGTGLAKLLAFLAVIGLIASFHTIIYAYGRQIYSLSRAGYYLGFMSITHQQQKVPHWRSTRALCSASPPCLAVWFIAGRRKGASVIGGTLLNMAVFGAMISYAMQGLSFILLRRRMPDIRSALSKPARYSRRRRDQSSWLWSRCTSSCRTRPIAAVFMQWPPSMCWDCCTLAIFGRNHLILSPEEEFAMSRGALSHEDRGHALGHGAAQSQNRG